MSSARFDADDDDDTLLPPASLPKIPTAPPTPTSQLYRTTDPPRTPPLLLFLHLLLIPIKILTLYPYRLRATSQAKAL